MVKPDTKLKIAASAAARVRRALIIGVMTKAQHLKSPKRAVRPVRWEAHLAKLREFEFRRRYRMTRKSFAKLVDLI